MRKWLVEGIIRGINGIWSSCCRPGTSTQRTDWSAGITFCLLPWQPPPEPWQPEFTFPCLCSFLGLTKPHPAICIVKAEKQVTGAIWMYRQADEVNGWNSILLWWCRLCFLYFLTQTCRLTQHRAAGRYHLNIWKVSVVPNSGFPPVLIGPEEKQVWEIWECWFSCVSPALYSIRFRWKVPIFQGT